MRGCKLYIRGLLKGRHINTMHSTLLVLFCAATATAILDTRCYQEINPGPCRGYEPRYAYDPSTSQCVRFIFGGCFGNDNNFATKSECERTCMRARGPGISLLPIYPDSSSVCTLPLEPGPCFAYLPRYGFDASRGKCVRFIYGGCQGNGNNFESAAECQLACLEYMPMPIRR